MKKDIEWLKEEIGELPCVDTVFNSDGSSYIDSAVPVMAVYDLIDKLDDPEVLSQEWIDSNSINASHDGITDEYVHVDDLESLLVPKQELPVIPKYVADWIEHCKGNDLDLYEAFGHSGMSVEVSDLVGDMDADIFARAWLYGYEVEKEKLYYIKFSENQYAQRFNDSKIDSILVNDKSFAGRFTEKQIKKINPALMVFAVEV